MTVWAALQLVLITEPTTGNSVQTFILRAFGTTLGCLWGWAAYEAGSGNRIVCGVMIAIGIFPAAYVIVGSKYVKSGIVSSVSITVVALATEVGTVPGNVAHHVSRICIDNYQALGPRTISKDFLPLPLVLLSPL